MKNKIIRFFSISFIGLSVLSILSVSIMAFADPQKVMDLVQVKLTNNDAYSSIRGVFGGVGISIIAMILFVSRQKLTNGLWMLAILWGMYSLSRIVTIAVEGSLGSFGKQWLIIEATFTIIAVALASLKSNSSTVKNQRTSTFAQLQPPVA
jgi:nitrate reductase gamma subunit